MSEIDGRTYDELNLLAAELGMTAVFPNSNELLLDFDTPDQICNPQVLRALKSNGYYFKSQLLTTSQGGNKHLYIRLGRDVTPHERVILQSTLGSDPTREALSWVRLRDDAEVVHTLFETPEEYKKVLKWRGQSA
jgi:hypothetical protein